MESEKKEIYDLAYKKMLHPIGLVAILFLLGIICSVFVWIWIGWYIAWKIGLSAFIGYIICLLIYQMVKKTIIKSIEENFKDEEIELNPTYFQERLKKALEKHKNINKQE